MPKLRRALRSFTLQNLLIASLLLICFGFCHIARADYDSRLELGLGFAQLNTPSETDFEVSGEYEYRFRPKLGLGVSATYIFASAGGITLLAVPDVFVHPLGGEWLISLAPLLEFGPGSTSNFGFKVGTRVPIPLGPIELIPEVAVDFIANGPYTMFGLGIGF